jgi:hypothetical protein
MRCCLVTLVIAVAESVLLLAPAAQAETAPAVTVTVGNCVRAETDTYFKDAANRGAFGKLQHRRTHAFIDNQDVVRMNRDTLYSSGVFDLDAGPTLPFGAPRSSSSAMMWGCYMRSSSMAARPDRIQTGGANSAHFALVLDLPQCDS